MIRSPQNNKDTNILNNIFKEIRLLRNEISFFIPTESVKDYAHPQRIRNSYKKAIKRYPISA